MKLKSLRLANFRGIQDLRLEFSEQVNVLAGVNGAGKTAVLDCASIMLSRLVGRIRSTTGTGRFFSEYDITNGMSETHSVIEIMFKNHLVDWRVSRTRRGRRRQSITGLEGVKTVVDFIHIRLDEDESLSLPIAVYYPTNRAVVDIPLRIRKTHPFDQLSAYDQSLSGKWRSFRIFFEWFRDREDLENERRLETPKFRDRELQAVRTAVKRFLPGFSGLRIRRAPLRMVVDKNGEELRVDQLSDGEKCTLAMVGDLARRMAIANPALEDSLAGDGVVLIDEVDLHLHPGWQRHVVSALEETFPNCQFLVSTHSPQIVSHVAPERIWLLERSTTGVSAIRPAESFGQTSGRILEDAMDVPERPQEIKERLSSLFMAIQQDELAMARQLLSSLTSTLGTDPELVRARIHIHRKEALGKR
jgi:predicted ATP-binding protein involved in virulence